MIHQNVQLHNVVELEEAEAGGVLLSRFPRSVRKRLSPLGRMVAQESAGVEFRFVTAAKSFRIAVGSLPSPLAPSELVGQDLFVFRGAFFHSRHQLTPGRVNYVTIANINGTDPFDSILAPSASGCGFSHNVWRVMFGRYPGVFFGLDTFDFNVRLPLAAELPSHRWLAYGSSITSGAGVTLHHNAYIYHAARIAGLDVYNQGLSGSCLCEQDVASYFAARHDWDVITLEVGVNMRGTFDVHAFEDRVTGLIQAITEAHLRKPVALISVFPNSESRGHTRAMDSESTRREEGYNAVLESLANKWPNVSVVKGSEILRDFSTLTIDLIHPSDFGHAEMGRNLAPHLAGLLKTTEQ